MLIRYCLYDPVSKKYGLMSYKKEVLDRYISNMVNTDLSWAIGTKYEKKYKKEKDYYSRLVIKKFRLIECEI